MDLHDNLGIPQIIIPINGVPLSNKILLGIPKQQIIFSRTKFLIALEVDFFNEIASDH